MNVLITICKWYIFIPLLFALGLTFAGIWQDVKHGPDHKFGYSVLRWDWHRSFWMIMVAIVATPILNLIALWYLDVFHSIGKALLKLIYKVKNFTWTFAGSQYQINWAAVVILSIAFGSAWLYQTYLYVK